MSSLLHYLPLYFFVLCVNNKDETFSPISGSQTIRRTTDSYVVFFSCLGLEKGTPLTTDPPLRPKGIVFLSIVGVSTYWEPQKSRHHSPSLPVLPPAGVVVRRSRPCPECLETLSDRPVSSSPSRSRFRDSVLKPPLTLTERLQFFFEGLQVATSGCLLPLFRVGGVRVVESPEPSVKHQVDRGIPLGQTLGGSGSCVRLSPHSPFLTRKTRSEPFIPSLFCSLTPRSPRARVRGVEVGLPVRLLSNRSWRPVVGLALG